MATNPPTTISALAEVIAKIVNQGNISVTLGDNAISVATQDSQATYPINQPHLTNENTTTFR